MRILALWVVKYYSGSTSERFVKPIEDLGHFVKVIPLEDGNVEAAVINELNKSHYDLIFHLPYPNTVRLEVIKGLKIPTVAWCGDDELMWRKNLKFFEQIEDSHTFCVTTHEPSLYRYRNGILASWGFSSDWKPKKVEKDIDIYFCGSRTPWRDSYIEALVDSGLKIVFDGPGYTGKITLKKMIDRYRRAKIGLSFVTENKDEFVYQQIKARTFEIPACGTFQLSEHCYELNKLFKIRKDIDVFTSENSLVSKCKYYLRNSHDRELIARSGYVTNKKYSYSKIFKRVFKEIGV